jgi:transposase
VTGERHQALVERIEQLEVQLEERERHIDALERQVSALLKEVAQVSALREQVQALTTQVAELEEELGRNSANSSKPPSSDEPAARAKRRGKRKKGLRKRGGQRGHQGHHRELVPLEDVDETVELFPVACSCCGGRLPKVVDDSPERHQVIDVPPIKPRVTEYRMHRVRCPRCGEKNRSWLPDGVPEGWFGPRLVAIIGLLTGGYRLSKRRAASLAEDLLGVRMSLGAVSRSEQRLSEAVAPAVDEALDFVRKQPVKYSDATSWQQGRCRKQLWTVAAALVTVFRIVADGTMKTVKGLLGRDRGVLVSDRASVFSFWAMKRRQVCWAHLIRNFAAMSERGGQSREVAKALLDCAHRLFKWWHRVRDGDLDLEAFRRQHIEPLKAEVSNLLAAGKSCDHARTRRTCANLLKHFDAMWKFAETQGVEPTNNHAERELRPLVIWRKTSFATQSDRGTCYIERVMTVVATLRKQGRHVLEYLTTAYANALKRQPPPSLLPADPLGT